MEFYLYALIALVIGSFLWKPVLIVAFSYYHQYRLKTDPIYRKCFDMVNSASSKVLTDIQNMNDAEKQAFVDSIR